MIKFNFRNELILATAYNYIQLVYRSYSIIYDIFGQLMFIIDKQFIQNFKYDLFAQKQNGK